MEWPSWLLLLYHTLLYAFQSRELNLQWTALIGIVLIDYCILLLSFISNSQLIIHISIDTFWFRMPYTICYMPVCHMQIIQMHC